MVVKLNGTEMINREIVNIVLPKEKQDQSKTMSTKASNILGLLLLLEWLVYDPNIFIKLFDLVQSSLF